MRNNSPAAVALSQFVYPYWSPAPTYGLQLPRMGEGGPSGDMANKGSTSIPSAPVTGYCGAPVGLAWLNILPPPEGMPLTRPASSQVPYGQASVYQPWTQIRGMMKSPVNGGA